MSLFKLQVFCFLSLEIFLKRARYIEYTQRIERKVKKKRFSDGFNGCVNQKTRRCRLLAGQKKNG